MSDEIANGAAPVADAASTAAPETAPASEAPAPSMRDTMIAVLKKYPTHGDDGRFRSRVPDEMQADAAPSEAAPATETTDQPETRADETAQSAPSIEPPGSWSADVRAKWAALPPDVQAYIAKRESEAHKAITETGERLKGYQALDAALTAPRREALRASFGNEADGLSHLFQLSDFATQNPGGFVQWFAQQHRIDLSRLTSTPAPASADPQATALQDRLQRPETTLTQQQIAQMDAQIKAFASAKDDAGKPMRPYFEEVREEMSRLLRAEVVGTLEEAYAKAVRTNDAVWAKVQAEEAAKRAKAEAEAQAKQREAAAKAAAEAKRAASVNVRTTGSVSGSPARPATMRDSMEAVARKFYGNAA